MSLSDRGRPQFSARSGTHVTRMRTSATKRAHGSGEEASQAAGKLARQHPGQGGGLTSLAYRFRGAQTVHYELRPGGGAGAP